MGMNSIFTQLMTPISGQGANSTEGVRSANAKPSGLGNISLFDMLLSHFVTEGQGKENGNDPDLLQLHKTRGPLESGNPLLEKNPVLDLARILAGNENIEEMARSFAALDGEPGENEAVDEAFYAMALNETGLAESITLDESSLETKDNGKSGDNTGLNGLFTARETLEALLEKLESRNEDVAEDSAVNDFIHGLDNALIRLTEVIEKVKAVQVEGEESIVKTEVDVPEDAGDVLSANALLSAEEDREGGREAMVLSKGQGAVHADAKSAFHTKEGILPSQIPGMTGTDGSLQDVVEGKFEGDPDAEGNLKEGRTAKTEKGQQTARMQDSPENAMGTQVLSAKGQESFDISMMFRPMGAGHDQGILEPFNPLMGMSSTAQMGAGAQASASSYSGGVHPATHVIMATIRQTAGRGQNTQIKLQLDPPELGRVDVKMVFDKDRKMRTSLTIEKPETYNLLQKDAHALERTLQNMGVDSEGGIEFELAGEGHNFQSDHGDERGANQSGSKSGQGRQGIIASDVEDFGVMRWSINPETGQTHYNLLV